MIKPIILVAGKYRVPVNGGAYVESSPGIVANIQVEILDDSEQLAVRPVFEGFAWNEMTQNQPAVPGYRTHNVGLYPTGKIDSGSAPGFKREFEEAIVIVHPLTIDALDFNAFGRITFTTLENEVNSSVVSVPTIQIVRGAPNVPTPNANQDLRAVFQFAVIKTTTGLMGL